MRRFSLGLIAVVVFGIVSSSLAGRGQNDGAAQKALDKNIPAINFNGVKLSEVFSFLSDITKVQFDVDWNALKDAGITKDTPVTLHVNNIPLAQVIEKLFGQLKPKSDLGFSAVGNKIRISTQEGLQKPK